MDFKIFANEYVALKFKVRILQFAVIVIAVSNVIFGFLAYSAVKQKQVVFYPVGYCGQFTVGTGSPSEDYILAMTKFIVHSLLTYTPHTVRKQYSIILTLFAPEVQNKYKKIFEDFVESAETVKLSSVFFIDKIKHDPKNNLILVKGEQIQILSDQVVESKFYTYLIKYRYVYGTFRILDLQKTTEEHDISVSAKNKNGGNV